MKILFQEEYDNLKGCIMVYPCNLQAKTQTVDKNLVSKQYNELINTLMEFWTRTLVLSLLWFTNLRIY